MPPKKPPRGNTIPGQGNFPFADHIGSAAVKLVASEPVPEQIQSPEHLDEETRLRAELDSLEALTQVSMSQGNITKKTNKKLKIENDLDYPEEDKDKRLAELEADIQKSKDAIIGLKLRSKGSFAISIGIQAKTFDIDKLDSDGKPVLDKKRQPMQEKVVRAIHADEIAILNHKHYDHVLKFAGKRNRNARNTRSKQINARLGELNQDQAA
jgi:hypothetical protein